MGKRGIAGIGQARRALALLALTIWALSAGLVRAETCAPGASKRARAKSSQLSGVCKPASSLRQPELWRALAQ